MCKDKWFSILNELTDQLCEERDPKEVIAMLDNCEDCGIDEMVELGFDDDDIEEVLWDNE